MRKIAIVLALAVSSLLVTAPAQAVPTHQVSAELKAKSCKLRDVYSVQFKTLDRAARKAAKKDRVVAEIMRWAANQARQLASDFEVLGMSGLDHPEDHRPGLVKEALADYGYWMRCNVLVRR